MSSDKSINGYWRHGPQWGDVIEAYRVDDTSGVSSLLNMYFGVYLTPDAIDTMKLSEIADLVWGSEDAGMDGPEDWMWDAHERDMMIDEGLAQHEEY